jgi:DNA-binding NarL/FixJ family response regulator
MPRAQILLADDHELFREGLAGLINSQTDLVVAGQASDGLEALTMARDLQPDLIVMDVKMPICDGLEATRLIRRERPEARIIILTVHDEDAKLFEAVKAGACGYILKSTKSASFLQGVRAALVGDAVLPPRLAGRLLQEFARLANNPVVNNAALQCNDLTPRESEVLRLIAAGATDKEIAQELSLSLHTVKSHVRNILGKLHAVNRRQAANIALHEGWVRKPSE